MAASTDEIKKKVVTIIKKDLSTDKIQLENSHIVIGSNAAVIAELYHFKTIKSMNKPRFEDNFTDEDLIKIYNRIANKNVKQISNDLKQELLYTLYRYN